MGRIRRRFVRGIWLASITTAGLLATSMPVAQAATEPVFTPSSGETITLPVDTAADAFTVTTVDAVTIHLSGLSNFAYVDAQPSAPACLSGSLPSDPVDVTVAADTTCTIRLKTTSTPSPGVSVQDSLTVTADYVAGGTAGPTVDYTVIATTPPTNDNLADAQDLSGLTIPGYAAGAGGQPATTVGVDGTANGATWETGEPLPSWCDPDCTGQIGGSVWYRYTSSDFSGRLGYRLVDASSGDPVTTGQLGVAAWALPQGSTYPDTMPDLASIVTAPGNEWPPSNLTHVRMLPGHTVWFQVYSVIDPGTGTPWNQPFRLELFQAPNEQDTIANAYDLSYYDVPSQAGWGSEDVGGTGTAGDGDTYHVTVDRVGRPANLWYTTVLTAAGHVQFTLSTEHLYTGEPSSIPIGLALFRAPSTATVSTPADLVLVTSATSSDQAGQQVAAISRDLTPGRYYWSVERGSGDAPAFYYATTRYDPTVDQAPSDTTSPGGSGPTGSVVTPPTGSTPVPVETPVETPPPYLLTVTPSTSGSVISGQPIVFTIREDGPYIPSPPTVAIHLNDNAVLSTDLPLTEGCTATATVGSGADERITDLLCTLPRWQNISWGTRHEASIWLRASGPELSSATATAELVSPACPNGCTASASILIETPPCTIRGTDGPDVIDGTAGNDVICGLGGDDVIRGMGGDDVIIGGTGNDRLAGDRDKAVGAIGATGNNDIILGGEGDDVIRGEEGSDYIEGGPGNDTIEGGKSANMDVIDGGAGNDTITSGAGDDRVWGGPGNDTIDGGSGNDRLFGGDGADTVKGADGRDWIDGEAGNDVLNGENHDDTIFGGEGADTIDGGAGDDQIDGGAGNDQIDGGDSKDVLVGGPGSDRIDGGRGKDQIDGGPGNDLLLGGPDNDLIVGGIGRDTLRGDAGNDTLRAAPDGPALDIVDGGPGTDTATVDRLDVVTAVENSSLIGAGVPVL
ncbi:MAG: hypothetical protein GC156_16415 [Actinomycetales bacterium]|nr:hypothetical protein [Actinomycetales bacterium]